MKMAKASEADLKMALELCSMLEGFERGHFPPGDDDGEANDFCIDLGTHCQSAMDKILDKLQEGSLFRVVFGMSVLLDPKNEAVDHSLDYLEHHPKVRMHDELVAALRSYMDAIHGAQDKQALMAAIRDADDKARAVLAKVGG